MFQYHHAQVILCTVGEVYIFKHGLSISALKQARMLIFINYVLLASTNTVYKYCHPWVI